MSAPELSNFAFLTELWPGLARLGLAAERTVHADPNSCFFELGLLGEGVTDEILACEGICFDREADAAGRLKALQGSGVLPPSVEHMLNSLRKAKNEAVHGGLDSPEQAMLYLHMAYTLCLWFARVYGDGEALEDCFTPPEDGGEDLTGADDGAGEAERFVPESREAAGALPSLSKEERAHRAREASASMVLSEAVSACLDRGELTLEASVAPVLHDNLLQNGIPVIRRLAVVNRTSEDLEQVDLRISATAGMCFPLARRIEFIPAGRTLVLDGIEMELNDEYLTELSRREKGALRFSLYRGEEELCSELYEVTALPPGEWQGLSSYPELLASFSRPNHPEAARICVHASFHLETWTGDPACNGYVSRDPNRVLAQAAAVYASLQEEEADCDSSVRSWSTVGQPMAVCEAVTERKLATPLELAMTYVSCLEAMGLHPLVILAGQRVYAGVWLEELTFPEAIRDDLSVVTKRMAEGVNEIAVVEAVHLAGLPRVTFDEAREMAERDLTVCSGAECILDITRARMSGVKPLPVRVGGETAASAERALPRHRVTAAPKTLVETRAAAEAQPEAVFPRQIQWERKLLDLGLRNQLINLRLNKSILPILTHSLDELENALSDGRDFTILSRPPELRGSSEKISPESVYDTGTIQPLLADDFRNARLHSVYTEAEVARVLKELYRSAKAAMEENGASTLYLAMGLLRWYEDKRSTKARYAPLVLIPVEIVRRSAAKGYIIRLREDEPQMNVTLLEKIKQDFGIAVPGVDPLPQDEHGVDVRRVFTLLRQAVMGQPRWDVLESAYLGIFSFSRFVMWNDVHSRVRELEQNKIVRSLIDGRLSWEAEEMQMGERVSEEAVYLPMPADASQLFAIQSACEGKSFVLHGPPGTGKSQTITAMIANALAQGRTVLFVAEKMAALEVVQRRLEAIGIGEFCLELHSNNAKKRSVLEQLRRASEVSDRGTSEQYTALAERMTGLRRELDVYVSELHRPLECGVSLFELINQYETVADAAELRPFGEEYARSLTAEGMARNRELVSSLVAAARAVGHPSRHGFAAIGCSQYHQRMRQDCREQAERTLPLLGQMEERAEAVAELLGLPLDTYGTLESLRRVAMELGRWRDWPVAWAKAEDAELYLADLQTLAQSHLICQKLPESNPPAYGRMQSLTAAIRQESQRCAEALERLYAAAQRVCGLTGLALPKSEGELEHCSEIMGELDFWTAVPAVWAKVENRNLYFGDIASMARHFMTAEEIRERNRHLWQDSVWDLNGVALLEEYRAANAKWKLPRSLAHGRLHRQLRVHAKEKPVRAQLGQYLEDLARYRSERDEAERLFEQYKRDLDTYMGTEAMDWARILKDAERARESLLQMREVLDAGELAETFAGSVKHARDFRAYTEADAAHREARNTLCALLLPRFDVELTDYRTQLGELYAEAEKNAEGLAVWMTWQTLAYPFHTAEGSASDPATLEDLGVFAHAFLSPVMRDWMPMGTLTEVRGAETEGLSADELAACYHSFTAYMTACMTVTELEEEFSADLGGLYKGAKTDWQRVLEMAEDASLSARVLREQSGDSRVRREFAGDGEILPDLEDFLEADEKFREQYGVFEALLSLRDTAHEPNWIASQRALCLEICTRSEDLREWFAWNAVCEEAVSAGLDNVVEAYREGLPHEEIGNAYTKAICHRLAVSAVDGSKLLNGFTGSSFNERIQRFKQMDAELIRLTQKEIRCRLAARVPSFAREAARSSEISILQRAIRSGGRGISIRKLFEQLPNLLPKLCPCMLMSPISAAQYLDPKREPFDLVVFDEASQLPTCKAVGVLARGKNAVIVGDPKQMPPTSFFSTNTVDEENLEEEDLESILDDCLALHMPQTHLLWHYRSRHESLIAFSNSRFYENQLLTFPSVNDRESKVSLVRVGGMFERGKSRCNRAEAEAVVAELKRRCHDPAACGQSVGVVTFNVSQQNLIDDLLSEACTGDPLLETWTYESEEPLFIKNLENVQGDERDVILFSVGYGPDEEGRVYMNFGPLNREGGWRRLNVAVSRARQEMVIFSSMTADQINLSKTNAEGVAALKAFLEYADGGKLPASERTAQRYDSGAEGIAASICEALEAHGYRTDRNVGHSQYRIDIGVVDPSDEGRYLLGILLDGGAYCRAKTARDRELAQIGVLNGLGWQILRVWSMDWWDSRAKELERILQRLAEIRAGKDTDGQGGTPAEGAQGRGTGEPVSGGVSADGGAAARGIRAEDGGLASAETEGTGGSAAATPAEPISAYPLSDYRAAVLKPLDADAELILTGVYDRELTRRIREVLACESPIRESLLTRRVTQSCGITRVGSRLQTKLGGLYRGMKLSTTREEGHTVYWAEGADPGAFRCIRRNPEEECDHRDARDVPVCEAVNALCRTLEEQFCLSETDLIRESARLMGFTRLGSNVELLFRGAILSAIKSHRITEGLGGTWMLSGGGKG